MDAINDACLLVFDTLSNDPESEELIQQMDEAENDDDIKEGLRKAVLRLDEINPAVAKEVRAKAQGFAF